MEEEEKKVNKVGRGITDAVKVPISKMEPKKVASTVATFLNERIIRRSESVLKRRISYSYQADG